MNREEAKNKVMTIYGSLSEDMKQAIDVLVDAPKSELEQMGELINRQAVLAHIDCLQYAGWGGHGLFEYLREYVKKMPTEEGQEWVPIAERMPEHAGLYLLLYERRCGIEEMAVVSFSVHTPGQFTFEYEAKQDILRPIAWLSITPYKQEGSDKE